MFTTLTATAVPILKHSVEQLKKAIEKDLAARYSLNEDWKIPVWLRFPETEFEYFEFRDRRNEDGNIIGSYIIEKKYKSTKENNVCDGATLSPNKIKGIEPAAVYHDPWHLNKSNFVKAWKGKKIQVYNSSGNIVATIEPTEKNIIKIGDDIFENIIRAEDGSPRIARLYYNGVRYGYPLFRIMKPILERLG